MIMLRMMMLLTGDWAWPRANHEAAKPRQALGRILDFPPQTTRTTSVLLHRDLPPPLSPPSPSPRGPRLCWPGSTPSTIN